MWGWDGGGVVDFREGAGSVDRAARSPPFSENSCRTLSRTSAEEEAEPREDCTAGASEGAGAVLLGALSKSEGFRDPSCGAIGVEWKIERRVKEEGGGKEVGGVEERGGKGGI